MCRVVLSSLEDGLSWDGQAPASSSSWAAWVDGIKRVGAGMDTLVINVRYTDESYIPLKRDLDEDLLTRLDGLQREARLSESAVVSPWSFEGYPLFIEPYGAGKQWRWRLTCCLLTLTVSRGTFNDLIAQVRFSSEYLWQEAWAGNALYKVHVLLMNIFGEHLHLQVSEVHLCADVVGFDFSTVNHEQHFISRVRKSGVIYTAGTDEVIQDGRRISTLRFSGHGSPLSCTIYNKTQEIKQKSGKTWFYDLWRRNGWDSKAEVWRVEFRFKRDFLHNLTTPIEGAYDLLSHVQSLWEYAAGRPAGGEDGYPDGWLRYIIPTDDQNSSRWPVHPAWKVVQAAFVEPVEAGLGPVVRERIREKNLERGVAAMIGYSSTLASWLGGEYADAESDVSLTFQWLYAEGMKYLKKKRLDFHQEVKRKQLRNTPSDTTEGDDNETF